MRWIVDPAGIPGKAGGPRIGHQMDPHAAIGELPGHRLGREQVAAGAARGEHERRAHNALPASRRRVSASSIPIPNPSASIEEPP